MPGSSGESGGRPGAVALSVIVITRDEEANIAACLASVSFAREIVVVDSGSRDRTIELAVAAGAPRIGRMIRAWRSAPRATQAHSTRWTRHSPRIVMP